MAGKQRKLSRADKALLEAAKNGDVEGIKKERQGSMFQRPADINAQSELGRTALFLAAAGN